MKWFLILFSLAWVATGAFIIMYTERSRQLSEKWITSVPEKILALIAAVVGVLLFLSAGSIDHSAFVIFLGVIALAKAAVIFFDPADIWVKLKTVYLEEASDQFYRLQGIIALIVGTALFSWIF